MYKKIYRPYFLQFITFQLMKHASIFSMSNPSPCIIVSIGFITESEYRPVHVCIIPLINLIFLGLCLKNLNLNFNLIISTPLQSLLTATLISYFASIFSRHFATFATMSQYFSYLNAVPASWKTVLRRYQALPESSDQVD